MIAIPADVKKSIKENIAADRIIFKKDGTVEFRRSYYYPNGTAEKFAKRIADDLSKIKRIPELVSVEDRWAPWPRDSFFRAVFRVY